ncbi:MAG TPA: hypothetical protein VFB16_11830 [Bauldia sp.]|nr:hypothetical protein [Bauldia sp.]
MILRRLFVLFAGLVLLAACSEKSESPYIEIRGGGFLFNYRLAEATAGFVAVPLKPLPDGAAIEASFENPAGGAPLTMRQAASASQKMFEFTTPPLTGVVKDKQYALTVKLVGADGKILQEIHKTLKSDLDQSVLPAKPPTIGPGYAPNPDAEKP